MFSWVAQVTSFDTHTESPLVSIVMASHNRDIYLELAIDSILNQTYTNWELIIVDDGSHNPRTYTTLIHYMQKDPRIKVHLRYTHLGVSACRNYGILQARSELIAQMDDDDVIHPDRLKEQV